MTARIGLLAAVCVVLAVLHGVGLFEALSDRERMRAVIEGLGLWGPVLYVVTFALLEPFFVPGMVFMIPASLVWGVGQLFSYSLLGAILAGTVGFLFARYLARDFVAPRLPPRIRAWDERIGESGLSTVILMRFLFFLAPPVHWVLGLSKVPFPTFLLGSLIGFAPPTFVMSWFLVRFGADISQ